MEQPDQKKVMCELINTFRNFTTFNLFLLIFRRHKPNEPFDACRVHGSLTLNKVAGNFHIAAGKSVPLMRGHAHLTTLFDDNSVIMLPGNLVEIFSFFPRNLREKLRISP